MVKVLNSVTLAAVPHMESSPHYDYSKAKFEEIFWKEARASRL